MAAPVRPTMTGVHKLLVGQFVILKLVEREETWAEAEGAEDHDDDAFKDEAIGWAGGYGEVNQDAIKVPDASRKAASLAGRDYDVLSEQVALHILSGRGSGELRVAFASDFKEAYGVDLVDVISPQLRPMARSAAAGSVVPSTRCYSSVV